MTETTANVQERRRLELQAKFEAVPGVKEVYFQPPSSVKLKFPCIVYNQDGGKTQFADNSPYHYMRRYSGKVIDPDPDSSIRDYICTNFKLCYPGQHYVANNLNHDTFTLYY